jgi:hypothetical protein
MKDIKGFEPPPPQLVCPMRKSGGPCVQGGCAWWHDDQCSVRSIAVSLYDMVPKEPVYDSDSPTVGGKSWYTVGGKPWHPIVGGTVDDEDVPF